MVKKCLTKIEAGGKSARVVADLSPFCISVHSLSPSSPLRLSLFFISQLAEVTPCVCSVTLNCHLPLLASHLCPLLARARHGTLTPPPPLPPTPPPPPPPLAPWNITSHSVPLSVKAFSVDWGYQIFSNNFFCQIIFSTPSMYFNSVFFGLTPSQYDVTYHVIFKHYL